MPQDYFPVSSFYFKVDIGGSELSFQEVSGLEYQMETEDVAEGGVNDHIWRLPKRVKFNNLILKRGYTLFNTEIFFWIQNKALNLTNLDEAMDVRDMTISLMDEEDFEVLSWKVSKAYPVKLSMSNLNAEENKLAIETIEFAHQGFTIE